MGVPYLIHVPDGDELWLVDGEQRMLITPRIYDLLASNGADLPPAYGIEELREQNTKLRELCEWLLEPYRLGAVTGEGVDRQWCRETYDGGSYRLHELGAEVEG